MSHPMLRTSILGLVLAIAAAPSAVAQFTPIPLERRFPGSSQMQLDPSLLRRNCPDLAAEAIEFRLLARDSVRRFEGRVRVMGTVRNRGAVAFESGINQQSVQLYENDRLVASQPFQTLAPRAAVQVSFTRPWSAAMEFPPTYKLVISYDPDIYLDGNPKNDDCAGYNNRLERSGIEVHELFAGG